MHREEGHRLTSLEEAADGLPITPEYEAEADQREHHEHRNSTTPHCREGPESGQIG
ncbi:hypothetical protein [Streptomyces sp. OspMP-M43]|uniref:hypothetical protein n=1 Tax=Streptomyces sp. OspMP-M43 TaxID=1839781 RepID=UPI00159EFE14|nr:hypothetical protein [Streptomyces sp. OspMP-M43]